MVDLVSEEQPPPADGVEFMILSRGRSGSTVIADDLDMHPDISCHQEVFTLSQAVMDQMTVPAYCKFESTYPGTPTPEAYFRRLWGIRSGDTRVLGYKVLTSHIEGFPERMDYFLSGRVKTIYSVRNPVGVALSSCIAAARGVYNVKADDRKGRSALQAMGPVTLDPEQVVNEAGYDTYWTATWLERLRGRVDHIVVDYDRYVQDRAAELNRCFEFLGVKASSVSDSRYMKVTSKAYADEIANKGEVLDALSRAGLDLSPLVGDAA